MPVRKRGSRRRAGARAGTAVPARRGQPAPARRVPSRPVEPATVVVHPNLLVAIGRQAATAGELETGGPLIGTVQRSWEADGRPSSLIVSLLGAVPPGPALRATESSVSLGRSADGERAASALRWWRTVTGLELVHLGDWHKHDFSAPEPSPGDLATAKEMRAEAAGPVWLAAIAVGECSEKVETGAGGNRGRVARFAAHFEHMRFYRAISGKGLVPMPIRVEANALPGLPALPWHVADPARFGAECRLLAAAGFSVAIDASSSHTRPGLELSLQRDGEPEFTAFTGPDYPLEPPLLRDGSGRRVKTSDPWSAGRFLVDLVREES